MHTLLPFRIAAVEFATHRDESAEPSPISTGTSTKSCAIAHLICPAVTGEQLPHRAMIVPTGLGRSNFAVPRAIPPLTQVAHSADSTPDEPTTNNGRSTL